MSFRSNIFPLAVLLLWAFVSEAASLTGKVTFKGEAPKPSRINMAADPNCAQLNKSAAAEQTAVGKSGGLANVFVYIKDGLKTPAASSPKQPVILDQKGCRYTPHVIGIQVGQPLQIVNSDPTLHNVHSMGKGNSQFNLGMPVQGMSTTKIFSAPEIGMKFKCDVHPWMAAWINVVSHPYFAMTDNTGAFEIKNLPAGTYKIEAWHEIYGTQEKTATVSDKAADISFEFGANK